MMMNGAMLCGLAAMLCLPGSAPAAEKGLVSWGKSGVSFADYRRDAVECGRTGYYMDVAGTEAAAVFKRASRQLEANEAGIQDLPPLQQLNAITTSAQVVAGTRPDVRFAEVRTLQEDTVTTCLRAKGYTPFALTRPQQLRLRKLRAGSAERHSFLYRLASDPAVLSRQMVSGGAAESRLR